ncbi:PfkB family carbohydrate kinase [Saxibacter everestensis]|uniref:PfkB family carbohydrate kinase n=1 Tax=Saxibacter everestensis TaxID=2909229 RepID=A0ABY8QTK5_9MICO|nr:PfkB family carbohydrate kinase [Brevibacteriaceae bacterium ZFBP1038]
MSAQRGTTRIAVVGDVLLDVDLSGSSNRLCPDSPAPVVDIDATERRAGGAGLVARMLRRDGREVSLVTVLSDDESATELREHLRDIDLIAGPSGAATPVKTRLQSAGQSVARFDVGCSRPPLPEVTDEMLAAVESADAVIVSDYGRRLTENPRLRQVLERKAARSPVVWDPHPSGAPPVPGVAVATPNLSEAQRASGVAGDDIPAVAEAADILRAEWKCESLVVTLGSRGALIAHGRRDVGVPQVISAPLDSQGDACGAGDRFVASLTADLASGAGHPEAVARAVRESSAYLAAGGISTLNRIADPGQLAGQYVDAQRIATSTRDAGGTVVATGGCFDLMHAGHARTLAAARQLGDCLIVCLNSDASIKRLKGAERPIIGEHDRVELLNALECVDAVVVFDEDTPEKTLESLRPDLWVKGGDYSADQLPESRLLASWGGRTVTVPFYPARSTSRLAAALAEVG